ncbi:putative enoyl-CoA hydratase echA8 [Variovorax sp. PBS-H4]|uniref:enoyl-CoA hydratase/isomerase family protein n=1 Tax=Variovorax sp. PBS-H4 TaxID=434008 RepID=UPI0013196F0B|nr:enoyl-CoA hydratase-related protein [Variovorax sp. PBS-H4]VTU37311.1 putative enoyl-CoA hydratase echA8 [Variovorax sp. PBS-H4]
MTYSSYETLSFSQSGAVLTVRLNRPQALNAVSATLHNELSRVFADIAADASVDAVVLTGEGRAFSAGGDLEWFRDITPAQLDVLFVEARKIILDLVELPQPIVSAVNGVAAGLGATLALFCDVIYAADNARLADPHVRIGVTAGDGGAVIWPLLVGMSRAKEYLMTGDSLTAVEAERVGLVNHVVPADELVAQAQALAHRLAQGSRMAIRSTKASLNKHVREAVNLVLDTSLSLEKECFSSSFHKQAIEAFAAQR